VCSTFTTLSDNSRTPSLTRKSWTISNALIFISMTRISSPREKTEILSIIKAKGTIEDTLLKSGMIRPIMIKRIKIPLIVNKILLSVKQMIQIILVNKSLDRLKSWTSLSNWALRISLKKRNAKPAMLSHKKQTRRRKILKSSLTNKVRVRNEQSQKPSKAKERAVNSHEKINNSAK